MTEHEIHNGRKKLLVQVQPYHGSTDCMWHEHRDVLYMGEEDKEIRTGGSYFSRESHQEDKIKINMPPAPLIDSQTLNDGH